MQDQDNLADIRSVGDKLENQELYEIPVLITNGIDNSDSSYQEQQITILSPTPLEKVGNVADRIVCKDGVWGVEKNIKTFIIDGSDSTLIVDNGGCTDNTLFLKGKSPDAKLYQLCIANYASYLGYRDLYNQDVEGVLIGTPHLGYDENCYIVTLNKSKASDISSARQYLKSNPVLVKYILAQPQFIPLPHSQQIKLRTFANKTNISFGCEIEPTLKASVPKSIGATVNTHSEQIDNLSKELEKINNLEESVTSEVISESDFTIVENTSNGYFEGVKLEGKTLVNLIDVSDWLAEETIITATDTVNTSVINFRPNVSSHISETIKAGDKLTLISKLSFSRVSGSGQCYIQMNYTTIDDRDKKLFSSNEFDNISCLITIPEDFKAINSIFVGVQPNTSVKFKNNGIVLLEGDHTQNPPEFFEGLKSVGQDVEEISVLSSNKEETKEDKKRILYYNDETQTWEKPILRQWDSIEKHSDNKYYYHVRSEEVSYTEGDETKADHITDMTTTVKKLSTEKVYECTNLDLIIYSGETNLLVKSGVLNPKVTLKVKKSIGNVVTMLQNKVAMLEELVNKLIQK